MTKEEILDKFKPLVTTWDCYWDVPRDSDSIKEDAEKCFAIAEEYANLRLSEQKEKHDKEMQEFAEWVLNKGWNYVYKHNVCIWRVELEPKRITGLELYKIYEKSKQ